MEFKVLLVNPDYDIERYMGRHFGKMAWVMPPMGLLYLAARLEHEGIEVEVFDAQIERRSLKDALVSFAPDIVGLTCASALVESCIAAAKLTKAQDPTTLVIVGGVHPTVRPEDLLSSQNIDVAVRGEGLETIVELAKKASVPYDFAAIDGISFRTDGAISHTKNRPLVQDVDSFPFPARHLLPMDQYRMSPDLSLRRPFDIIFTAYGCPYDCVFCGAQTVMGGSFRMRSINNVMDEIDLVINKNKIRSLLVGDDNFMISQERTLEFCDNYASRGHHKTVPWQIATRVDSVDQRSLEAVKNAGCYLVSFGIESGVKRSLNTAEKGIDVETSERAVRLAKEAGLIVRATFILGLPGETRSESLETIRFAQGMPLDQLRFALATPYPGTRLWQIAIDEGAKEIEDWMALSSMAGYRPEELFYVPKGRQSEELKKLQRRANFNFYFRPRIMYGFLKRIRSFEDITEYGRGGWGLLKATLSPY